MCILLTSLSSLASSLYISSASSGGALCARVLSSLISLTSSHFYMFISPSLFSLFSSLFSLLGLRSRASRASSARLSWRSVVRAFRTSGRLISRHVLSILAASYVFDQPLSLLSSTFSLFWSSGSSRGALGSSLGTPGTPLGALGEAFGTSRGLLLELLFAPFPLPFDPPQLGALIFNNSWFYLGKTIYSETCAIMEREARKAARAGNTASRARAGRAARTTRTR